MPDRTVAGRYELLGQLGSGGMSVVWRARDRALDRPVAVKLLHPGLAGHDMFVERFRREARHAAQLSHPNVVTVFDTGLEGPDAYIVMELVDGTDLRKLLKRTGPLPVARTVRIGLPLLAALGHAHARGLVHRDVKPGNVLIAEDGTVKVTDFGIAKGAEDAGLTRTGTMMGTASYLAPEQVSGHAATAASDIYGAGCLLYECLAGSPPFTGDSPVAIALKHQQEMPATLRTVRPDVPPQLEAVVMKALEKRPDDRFPSAAEMRTALAATGLGDAADAEPTVAMGPVGEPTTDIGPIPAVTSTQVMSRPTPPPDRWARGFRTAAILLAVAAVLWLLGFLAVTALRTDDVPTPTPDPVIEETEEPTLTPAPRPVTARPATPEPEPTPEPTPEPEPSPPPITPDVPGISGGPVTPAP